MRRQLAVVLVAVALLAGCAAEPEVGDDVTLRVLAGSEVADLQPILDEAARVTGVRVELDVTGTLAGAETIAAGAADAEHDAVWFSSNRYVSLQPAAQARLGASVEIMSSPVVLGLRRSVAQQLGWVGRPVTWSEIAAAAGARRFSYGMTDPSASNSGFSTVVAVATALAGSGSALTVEQAASTDQGLRDFFAAQTLAAGSSAFLVDAYVRRATGVDPGPAVDGGAAGPHRPCRRPARRGGARRRCRSRRRGTHPRAAASLRSRSRRRSTARSMIHCSPDVPEGVIARLP